MLVNHCRTKPATTACGMPYLRHIKGACLLSVQSAFRWAPRGQGLQPRPGHAMASIPRPRETKIPGTSWPPFRYQLLRSSRTLTMPASTLAVFNCAALCVHWQFSKASTANYNLEAVSEVGSSAARSSPREPKSARNRRSQPLHGATTLGIESFFAGRTLHRLHFDV